MRSGMQDPIITLYNIFTLPPILDTNNNPVRVYTYYSEEIFKERRNVWVAIGQVSGQTPRDTFLSLRGSGYRYWRSWRYPIYIGGWDDKNIYRVYSEVMKRIREQGLSHTDAPEYIEHMYIENLGSFEQEEEDVVPPLKIMVLFVVMEFLEF